MNLGKRFLSITNLLFFILIAVQFLPDKIDKEAHSSYVIWLAVGIEVLVIVLTFVLKKAEGFNLVKDIVGFIYAFLIIWTLLTAKFDLLSEVFFPPPGRVLVQFTEDITAILNNIKSSVITVFEGFFLASVIAIPLGLIFGCFTRLGNAATYISKFLGSIPPIVYIPYGIALLPTFHSVSVFVIFLATFFPVLGSTMGGVIHMDEKLINSAKVLNVSKFTLLTSVIFPAVLPQIFTGCNTGLATSFVLLTSAEMIAARDGLGFYIKQYSDFGDYTRVVLGIIIIGIVIVAISYLINTLERKIIKWKN